jgi:hypothetical protein
MEYLSAGANMRNAARQAAAHAPSSYGGQMTMQPFQGGMPMGGGLTSHMSDGPGWQPSYGAQPQGPMRSFSSGPMAPSPMHGGMPQMQHFGDGGMARGMMQQPQMPMQMQHFGDGGMFRGMQQPQMQQFGSQAAQMRNDARRAAAGLPVRQYGNALSGFGASGGGNNALGAFGR